jgi:hypothetical protein
MILPVEQGDADRHLFQCACGGETAKPTADDDHARKISVMNIHAVDELEVSSTRHFSTFGGVCESFHKVSARRGY